jgi:hypothetical protein
MVGSARISRTRILAGETDEETGHLVGAHDRIERRRFAPATIGHGDGVFAQ